jgi:hypothetical protein
MSSTNSTIETRLATVKVTEGQGVSEGAFELQLEVKDDSGKSITWPAQGSSAKVDNNGSTYTIDEQVSLFTISGPVSKKYSVHAIEVDKGFNGQNDEGDGSVTFDLTPDMALIPKSATIDLYTKHRKHGQIQVSLTAGPPK